jgi:hypothetical protein
MLTLWENYSWFDYWGEYDEQSHLIELLEPCSTGTRLITTTDLGASKASTVCISEIGGLGVRSWNCPVENPLFHPHIHP